jgi:hypothetical protein
LSSLLPYEQTIATKLDELALPDMADAIWADISAQLDGDLPQDGDNPAPNEPPQGGTSWGTGIKLAIGTAGIALVAYWLTQTNKASTTPMPSIPVPTEQKATLGDTVQQFQPVQPVNPNNTDLPIIKSLPPNTPATSNNTALLPIAADSLRLQTTDVPTSKPDSAVAPISTPSLVLPPPGKKKRGTQGIQDSDYKFVQGKDST